MHRQNSTFSFQGSLLCGSLFAGPSVSLITVPGFANGSPVLEDIEDATNVDFALESEHLVAAADDLCLADSIPANVSAAGQITFAAAASANNSLVAFSVNASDIKYVLLPFPSGLARLTLPFGIQVWQPRLRSCSPMLLRLRTSLWQFKLKTTIPSPSTTSTSTRVEYLVEELLTLCARRRP